jgi:hypothetical protein
MQLLNRSDVSLSPSLKTVKTKLFTIWVKKKDMFGREYLAGIWTAQD